MSASSSLSSTSPAAFASASALSTSALNLPSHLQPKPEPESAAAAVPSVSGSKFYYMNLSCASACMVVICTLGLKGIALEQVQLPAHTTHSGKDFYSINPKGNVPYLVLPNGQALNESAAVLQFLADQKPEEALAGRWGTMERYLVQNALNHLSSEVHVALRLMHLEKEHSHADYLVEKAKNKLAYVNKELQGKKFYVLDRFTVADCYLFFLLNWIQFFGRFGIQIDDYPNVKDYHQHIGALPQIEQTIKLMASNPETSD